MSFLYLFAKKIKIFLNNHVYIKKFLIVVNVILFLMFSWTQIELSSVFSNWTQLLEMNIHYKIINFMTYFVIFLLIMLVVNSCWKSCFIFSILMLLISVVNYFTIKFHGTPLTFMELKNFKTALSVIGGYKFNVSEVRNLLFIFFLEVLISLFIRWITGKSNNKSNLKTIMLRSFCICFISILILYSCYFSSNPLMKGTVGWTWQEAYYEYGYLACTIKSTVTFFNYLEKPDGYCKNSVNEIKIKKDKDDKLQSEFPDIILILNESFYDLSLISNIKTDIPYLENINNLENTIKGYAVVPAVGGGTNNSEYELLTSNSLHLMMPDITPFNVIDMNGANSVVSHLKQLGYHTVGSHSEPGYVYNRFKAYNNIGFETVCFDADFINKVSYGNRWTTDESLYNNLLLWMDQNTELPQFLYLLTIQNHGPWEMNDSNMDIVHALNDFGEYNDQVDEYLTSIYMTDTAFKNFTNLLKEFDRKIIVCMVGDHCPSFAKDIVDEEYDKDRELLLRSTPFVIWANYDIEDMNIGKISINYMVPTLFEVAGIELSPYYQYMLNLRKDIPILTSYDVYYDNDMKKYQYDLESTYSNKVEDYFYLEYNNLQREREQELFDVYE